ncbi:MAG: hypothetical protein HY064_17015 [Bacteroidetes bacterium]|nr:hypothetical protein [Bacteroidota bacterium]
MKLPNKKFFIYLFLILLVTAVAVFALVYFYLQPDEKDPNCTGRDRWNIKTLTDTGEKKINYTAQNSTVASLITILPQKISGDSTSRFGIEFNSYSIQCRIREYKLSDDGDFHLVLVDLNDPSKTMIGEIPDPWCASVKLSSHLSQYVQARKDFQNTLSASQEIDTNAVYSITGIAFYDKVHGQLGVAPTGIEIHPVLSISKNK